MVRMDEMYDKLYKALDARSRASSPKICRDLDKHIKRLRKQIREAKMYLEAAKA